MSWSTSELRVRLAPLNRFKPSSKIFYWPFQGGTSFVDLLCFCSVLCLLCFVRVCLYVLFGHLLGKGWPLGSRLWCLLWVCHFPIGILGQVWYLIVSIPDLCTITYFYALDMIFLKLCHRSRSQWPKNGTRHSTIRRCIHTPNLGFLSQIIQEICCGHDKSKNRLEVKVTVTRKLDQTLCHAKMHSHTKFGIPTSNNIGDTHQTQCQL